MVRKIAIVNRKGGVAKTTSTVNIGARLAELGKRVLVIDLDPQGSVAIALGLQHNGATIGGLLEGTQLLGKCIYPADRSAEGLPRPNLFVLPADGSLATSKVRLLNRVTMSAIEAQTTAGVETFRMDRVLVDALQPLEDRNIFDYILIDCPPSLDTLNNAVYQYVDEAIVPVRADFLSAAGAAQHTRDIIEAQQKDIRIRVSYVIPTFVVPRQVMSREIYTALVKMYGKDHVTYPIPQSVDLQKAPATGGRTIFEYAPKSQPAVAYGKVASQIAKG